MIAGITKSASRESPGRPGNIVDGGSAPGRRQRRSRVGRAAIRRRSPQGRQRDRAPIDGAATETIAADTEMAAHRRCSRVQVADGVGRLQTTGGFAGPRLVVVVWY